MYQVLITDFLAGKHSTWGSEDCAKGLLSAGGPAEGEEPHVLLLGVHLPEQPLTCGDGSGLGWLRFLVGAS